MSWIDRAPDRLIALAMWLAPANRRDWLLAMRCELPYLPRHCRLEFALGAAKVALTERIIEMKRMALRPLDGLILLTTAFLALATTGNGIRQFAHDPAVAISFCVLALAWSSIFVAALFGRYRFVSRMACAGCALSFAIGLASLMPDQMPAANLSLMRGLAMEGVVLFVALFGAASFALRRAGQPS